MGLARGARTPGAAGGAAGRGVSRRRRRRPARRARPAGRRRFRAPGTATSCRSISAFAPPIWWAAAAARRTAATAASRRRRASPAPRQRRAGDGSADDASPPAWCDGRATASPARSPRSTTRAAARVFTVMDDNLLPLAPDDAEHFLRRLADGLRRERRRTDRAVAAIARRRGHAGGGRRAGRRGPGARVRRHRRLFAPAAGSSRPQRARRRRGRARSRTSRARGVFAVCNALLVGPTIPLESIRAELEGMRAIRGAPLHLLPIDVRAGTTLPRPRRAPRPAGRRVSLAPLPLRGSADRGARRGDHRAAVPPGGALGAARALRSRLQPRHRAPADSRAAARARGRDLRARQRRLERRPAPDPRGGGADRVRRRSGRRAPLRRRRGTARAPLRPRAARRDRGRVARGRGGGPRQRAPSGARAHPRPAAVGGRVLDGAGGLQPAAALGGWGPGRAPGRSRSAESSSADTTGTGPRPKSPSRTGPADADPTDAGFRFEVGYLLRPRAGGRK